MKQVEKLEKKRTALMSQIDKLKKAALVKGDQNHPKLEFCISSISFQTMQAKCLRMCEKQMRRNWKEMKPKLSDWQRLSKP